MSINQPFEGSTSKEMNTNQLLTLLFIFSSFIGVFSNKKKCNNLRSCVADCMQEEEGHKHKKHGRHNRHDSGTLAD